MKRLISVFASFLLLFPLTASAETFRPAPLFEASFLQGWLCRDWSAERFAAELADMQAAGMHTVILQSTVDTAYSGVELQSANALYPTALAAGQNHALESALLAAKDTGMQVWIGLLNDDRWWEQGWAEPDAACREWLRQNTAENCQIIAEIAALYGEAYAPQIAGFYNTNEIWNVTGTLAADYAALYAEQLGAIRTQLAETFPDKPLMLSPFYNSTLGTSAEYAGFLAQIVQDAGLRKQDILALQDGGGRDCDAGTIREWNIAVADACAPFVTVWVNNETFGADSAAKAPSLLKESYRATDFAQRHILFSWNHYYHGTELESAFAGLLRDMTGDLNADGRTDAADAVCLRVWLCQGTPAPACWQAGDTDGSGMLNAADLTLLKRLVFQEN